MTEEEAIQYLSEVTSLTFPDLNLLPTTMCEIKILLSPLTKKNPVFDGISTELLKIVTGFVSIGSRDSIVSVVTSYGVDGLGIESWWGETFCTSPDWPWGPPSLLYNGYQVSPSEGALQIEKSHLSHREIQLLPMEFHIDGRPAYSGMQPGFPRGSFDTAVDYPTAMQPLAQYLLL